MTMRKRGWAKLEQEESQRMERGTGRPIEEFKLGGKERRISMRCLFGSGELS